jgi:hypothetical protein
MLDTNAPIYVIELGSGHGKFTLLFARYLNELFVNDVRKRDSPMV